jgi:hypothetical protein
MPKEIKISELADNDTLSRTVSNKYNQVLLKKGTVLNTVQHLKILKTWGIESILIEDIGNEQLKEDSNTVDNELRDQVMEKLGWVKLNKDDQVLFDIIVESKIGNLN